MRARSANVRFRELRSLLLAAGWLERAGKGSHRRFSKGGRDIVLPNHPGALRSVIVKDALDSIEADLAGGG